MAHTVLIVEDHPLYRDALTHLVRTITGKTCVAAASAEEGMRLARGLAKLDLILLDPGLPGLNGAEAVRAFRRQHAGVRLIVISASENRQEAAAALRAGASAVISKAVSMETMEEVVRQALSEAVFRSQWVLPSGTETIGEESLLALTPRQREIMTLLSQGHTNKEIGMRLGLAEITVKVHVSAIFRMFNVVNRTQAVLAAQRYGLLEPDPEN